MAKVKINKLKKVKQQRNAFTEFCTFCHILKSLKFSYASNLFCMKLFLGNLNLHDCKNVLEKNLCFLAIAEQICIECGWV